MTDENARRRERADQDMWLERAKMQQRIHEAEKRAREDAEFEAMKKAAEEEEKKKKKI
jgi:hypothetical protein